MISVKTAWHDVQAVMLSSCSHLGAPEAASPPSERELAESARLSAAGTACDDADDDDADAAVTVHMKVSKVASQSLASAASLQMRLRARELVMMTKFFSLIISTRVNRLFAISTNPLAFFSLTALSGGQVKSVSVW